MIKEKTIVINYEQLEDMLVAHLYAIGAINDSDDVISLDLDIPVNDEGLVEFDIEYVSLPRNSHLTLVSDTTQPELPLA